MLLGLISDKRELLDLEFLPLRLNGERYSSFLNETLNEKVEYISLLDRHRIT